MWLSVIFNLGWLETLVYIPSTMGGQYGKGAMSIKVRRPVRYFGLPLTDN